MKFRLKKLFQTLTHSITAGTVKTVDEWTRIMPELWGSDLTKTFPDWFDKVERDFTAKAYIGGRFVAASDSREPKYKYDGRRIDNLYLQAALLESYQDVVDLIEFLQVTKCCFQHTTYNELPKQYPLTPKDCFEKTFTDALGKTVGNREVVYTKYKQGSQIIPMSAGLAFSLGMTFFKDYDKAKQCFYGV